MTTLLFLTFCVWSLNIVNSKKYEVIIMGAGMAGISAATELCAQGMNPRDILIIEGANYIGGRTKVTEFAGYSLNVGASWLDGACSSCNDSYAAQFEMNPMLQFVEEFGILYVVDDFSNETYFDPLYGDAINHTTLYSAYDEYEEALACAHDQYGATIGTVDYDKSKEDDSLRFALENCGWSDLNSYQTFVEWYEWDFESAVDPKQTCAFATHEIYGVYGPDELYITDPRGYNGIVSQLADELIDKGVKIQLDEMIASISYGDKNVIIHTKSGKKYKAKYGINTFSVGVLQSDTVYFIPTLPEWKQEVIDKHKMADYAVIYMQWPYDWWSHISNHSEQLLFIGEEKGYFQWARDLNLDRYFAGSNVWRVDVTEDIARKIQRQSVDDTVEEYLDKLSLYFEDVPYPVDVLITNWTNNILSFGSFADWNIGFTVDDWGLMTLPVCNLYFAGDATSRREYGYMSGAYWEGIRAANDVYLCINEPKNVLCDNSCYGGKYSKGSSDSDDSDGGSDDSDDSGDKNSGRRWHKVDAQEEVNSDGMYDKEAADEAFWTETMVLSVIGGGVLLIAAVLIFGACYLCKKKPRRRGHAVVDQDDEESICTRVEMSERRETETVQIMESVR